MRGRCDGLEVDGVCGFDCGDAEGDGEAKLPLRAEALKVTGGLDAEGGIVFEGDCGGAARAGVRLGSVLLIAVAGSQN